MNAVDRDLPLTLCAEVSDRVFGDRIATSDQRLLPLRVDTQR